MSTNPIIAETVRQHYRVDRRKIAFIRFVIEAYDGIAIVKTSDPQAGLVEFQIAPGCEPDLELIISDLKRNILMEKVETITVA